MGPGDFKDTDKEVDDATNSKEVHISEATSNFIREANSIMVALNKQAEVTFSYYRSLVDSGFTEAQAMEIILKRGIQS